MVVFGSDKHEPIVLCNLRGPGLGVGLRVVTQRRRRRLVEQRQVLFFEINQVVLRIVAALGDIVNSARDPLANAIGACASQYYSDPKHCLFSTMRTERAPRPVSLPGS
jgi:hypothetical protein